MVHSTTKAVQETTVGEGLALGLVAIGIDEFNGSRQSVQSAFRHAWQAWAFSRYFPVVQATLPRNDLLRIIAKSERRRSAHLAGWSSEWPFRVYVHGDWTVEEVGVQYEDSCGVALSAWTALARAFVEDLNLDLDDEH